jgi:hypothetical protein
VSWFDDRDGNYEIYFARISSTGSKLGTDIRITDDTASSFDPSLVWTGSEFGVAWQDGRIPVSEIYFARISSAGAKVGSDVQISNNSSNSDAASLAWTGSEFGVAWMDSRDLNFEIYFARISAAGSKLGSDTRITNDSDASWNPSIAWTGSEFGVSWQDDRDGNDEIYFARISAAGSKVGSDSRITNDSGYSTRPILVWTGSGFGVAWNDDRDSNHEIYFAQISSTGAKVEPDVRITNDGAISRYTALAWTTSELGVGWTDDRDGNDEIYFNLIGLCP